MKTALILNFTGNYYHYGCYGTSYEIYYRLLEHGYFVNYISVRATHGLECYPDTGEKFLDPDFAHKFTRANPTLFASLHEADIVVVNGEGTLHHLSKGSMTLLYMIYLASKIMKKDVYLINHSCYPMGDTSRGDVDLLYQQALSGLRDIVIREPLSACFYQASSIACTEGFDSLPLFMGRHDLLGLRNDGIDAGKIIICGGISYSEAMVSKIASALSATGNDHSFEFLVGGKSDLAPEDFDVLSLLEKAGLEVRLKEAKNFADWCGSMANAKLMVSGRFHYTVAAMALGVPCISFPSNTPKTRGIYQMFDLDGYLEWDDKDFSEKLDGLLVRAANNELALADDQRQLMIESAEKNYTGLARVG